MDFVVKDDMYISSGVIFLFQFKVVLLNHTIKFDR